MQVQEINGAVALKMEPSDLGSLWRRITRFTASFVEAQLTRQKRRVYESALAELPDYLLADIGVRQSDLSSGFGGWSYHDCRRPKVARKLF
jgi:hypothetical protein